MSKLYNVKVSLGKTKLEIENDNIIIGVTSEPKNNKANLEIIKRLAKHFNVPHHNGLPRKQVLLLAKLLQFA